MEITEDYVRKTIEEIAPLVEDLSGLKCDLKDYSVWIDKNYNFNERLAHYTPIVKMFVTGDNFKEGNIDYFKTVIGHEVMHNAQYSSFPEFEEEIRNSLMESWANGEKIKDYHIINKLIEGDATLIQRELNKEYFKKSRMNFLGMPLIHTKDIYLKNYSYHQWEKKLRDKFGTDRNQINKLYNYSLEDLTKVFE